MTHSLLDPVSRFLVTLAVIMLVCHLCGALAHRFRQPRVIGEILGGVLLGPSLLGALWPAGLHWLLPSSVFSALQMTAQLGSIMFLFLVGCELRLSHVRACRSTVGMVVLTAMGLPTLVGFLVALTPLVGRAEGGHGRLPFAVFLGLCLGVTALPVLARLLVDLGMNRTRLGTLALACAAAGDAVMWTGLTALLAATGAQSSDNLVRSAAIAVALVVVTVVAIRPALRALVGRAELRQESHLLLPVLVAGAILFAVVTSVIGLHPAIGAFLFGTVVPRDSIALERVQQQLRDFTLAVLLPVFFAVAVGLSTSIGLIGGSPTNWLMFVLVLAVACTTKFFGTTAAARGTGMSRSESRQLGALMNCRGVTELIVAAIGLQYGFINRLGFTVLVLVALVTTATSGPLVRAFANKRDVVEPSAEALEQVPAGELTKGR
jgi:Kef-type K+ transport system membrane component KefB